MEEDDESYDGAEDSDEDETLAREEALEDNEVSEKDVENFFQTLEDE